MIKYKETYPSRHTIDEDGIDTIRHYSSRDIIVINCFYTKHFDEIFPIIRKLQSHGFAQKYHVSQATLKEYYFVKVDSIATANNCEAVYQKARAILRNCPNAIMEIYD